VSTFKRNEAQLNEHVIQRIPLEATGTRCPKHNFRDAELLGCIKREGHADIRNDAAHGRVTRAVETAEEVHEGAEAVELSGVAEGGDVLRGVCIGRGKAIGYGLKPERGKPVKGIGPGGS